MFDGVYHVKFSSSTHDFGEGLIVVKGNVINGGDHGYLYQGHMEGSDDIVTGVFKIKQWNTMVPSVFGRIPKFELSLNGRQDSNSRSFSVSGNVVGQSQLIINITGRYLSEAL